MPVETLRPSDGRLAGVAFTSVRPFRILTKGPNYFRPPPEPGARKLSAVERLEADKAKYVKSQQVALTRQAPIQAPLIRKPLVPTAMMPQGHVGPPATRKVLPRGPGHLEKSGGLEGPGERRPFNLDILNNLISDVCDEGQSSSSSSPSSGGKSLCSSLSAEKLRHATSSSPSSCTSSLLSAPAPAAGLCRRPPPVPARGLALPTGAPNSVTVRRVDVRPQAEVKKPLRVALQPRLRPRQTPQGQSHNQLPSKVSTSSQTLPPSPMLFRAGFIPPASPAFTRISNASSKGSARKHPSLHRSKSDLSDRYSRATADLERFFNYCGLDPEEVEGLGGVERFTRANSDIVSVSKLRSVSTPSSECGDDERAREYGGDEDEEEDGPLRMNERVPYGISVIERNARVIKWLYGIRQAREAQGGVSNV
uniref:Family with sequence similarity 110 member A n=1 Tax=Cyprinodon variegatus TaxID=28743 RepID=A0A3Q2CQ00_CYPVA